MGLSKSSHEGDHMRSLFLVGIGSIKSAAGGKLIAPDGRGENIESTEFMLKQKGDEHESIVIYSHSGTSFWMQ